MGISKSGIFAGDPWITGCYSPAYPFAETIFIDQCIRPQWTDFICLMPGKLMACLEMGLPYITDAVANGNDRRTFDIIRFPVLLPEARRLLKLHKTVSTTIWNTCKILEDIQWFDWLQIINISLTVPSKLVFLFQPQSALAAIVDTGRPAVNYGLPVIWLIYRSETRHLFGDRFRDLPGRKTHPGYVIGSPNRNPRRFSFINSMVARMASAPYTGRQMGIFRNTHMFPRPYAAWKISTA